MKTIEITIKQVIKKNKIEVWIIQKDIDNFGKEYIKKELFDYCYKHQTKRLKEILQQADNLYGFNGLNLYGNKW